MGWFKLARTLPRLSNKPSLSITLLKRLAPATLQILAPRFNLGVTLVNLETDIEMTALILAVVIEVALPGMSWYVHL
jgi:hypothetical protein